MLQAYVGFTVSHILSTSHSWLYTKRSQKWEIATAALEVLQAALTSPLIGQGVPNSLGKCEPDWSLAQAVAEAVSKHGGPAGYLFVNLPPHAGQLIAHIPIALELQLCCGSYLIYFCLCFLVYSTACVQYSKLKAAGVFSSFLAHANMAYTYRRLTNI